jgi:hypothetical protein
MFSESDTGGTRGSTRKNIIPTKNPPDSDQGDFKKFKIKLFIV